MYHSDIQRDITISVHQAMDLGLEQLDASSLVHRSDALLARLPSISGSQSATTALFLGRYHARLHKELCRQQQPRALATTVEADLRDLTRAVLVTVGIGEGVSVEAAVGMALVLYSRGVTSFCSQPILRIAEATSA